MVVVIVETICSRWGRWRYIYNIKMLKWHCLQKNYLISIWRHTAFIWACQMSI